MKNLLPLLLALFLATACSKPPHIEYNVKTKNFIREQGKYHFANVVVVISELEDGTMLYGISNNKNKVFYQHPITKPLSNYQYWMLYVDNAENVWFYNSDLGEFLIHIRMGDGSYITKDGYSYLDNMPKDLKAELEQHNTFKNGQLAAPAEAE